MGSMLSVSGDFYDTRKKRNQSGQSKTPLQRMIAAGEERTRCILFLYQETVSSPIPLLRGSAAQNRPTAL